jgi:hypothetical protein
MGFLEEPEIPSRGAARRVTLILLVALGMGAVFLFLSRPTDDADTRPGAEPEPFVSAAPPPAEVIPEPAPSVAEPEAASEPEPAPEPVVPAPSPLLEPVRLRVTSDVDGAHVFIDRQYVGDTPFESSDVAPGPHRVNVAAPGYDGFSQDVEIGDAVTQLDVAFNLVRLDERVAVVHKHRFGDCAGYLVASLDGIHYQTDGEDAFTLAFDALEEFSVDYLEHNLRIRARRGRTFNFTDAEANADKLFVFHREVEQAIAQLR